MTRAASLNATLSSPAPRNRVELISDLNEHLLIPEPAAGLLEGAGVLAADDLRDVRDGYGVLTCQHRLPSPTIVSVGLMRTGDTMARRLPLPSASARCPGSVCSTRSLLRVLQSLEPAAEEGQHLIENPQRLAKTAVIASLPSMVCGVPSKRA